MPRFDIECLVVGTLRLGAVEAATAEEAELAGYKLVLREDYDLTARLPELQRVVVEHIMVEPARPAESKVTP